MTPSKRHTGNDSETLQIEVSREQKPEVASLQMNSNTDKGVD
ncbi:hypothetical protein [Vibrio sp. TBV020]